MKTAILQYIDGLQSGDLAKTIDLFAAGGLVHSPLYGDMMAKDFYSALFSDTQDSEITLLNILTSIDKPTIYAAHFRYHWTLLDNTHTHFECVDVFEFDENNKIKELTIIYDTFLARQNFEKR
jgi:hypothetical protein